MSAVELEQELAYNYVECKSSALSTSNSFIELSRYPDELILVNTDSSIIIYVNFDKAAASTNSLPIRPNSAQRIKLRCRRVGAVSASGTPTLFVCALAYRDERITA